MKNQVRLAAKFSHIARWLPTRMREQFGEEIGQVLAERLENAADQSWWLLLEVVVDELIKLPGVYLRERFNGQRHTGVGRLMMARIGAWFEENRAQTPWGSTLIGLVPFLIIPLVNLGSWLLERGVSQGMGAPSLSAVFGNVFYLLVGVYMLVLVVGWVRGFPAWVYPFAFQFMFMSLLMGLLFMDVFAHIEARILQNLLTVLSVLGLYGIIDGAALLLTRKNIRRPIQAGWNGLSHDVTRFSLGLFGLAPLVMTVTFDGLHIDLGWKIARDILLAVGALIYFRSRREGIGVGAMLVTMILAFSGTAVNLTLYWSSQQGVDLSAASNAMKNLTTVLSCAVPIIIFTFGPWWVQRVSQLHSD